MHSDDDNDNDNDDRGDNNDEAVLGRSDGFGHWGLLDVVDDEEHVVCHECGHPFRSLGSHAVRAHAMSAARYRTAHGLPPDTCLAAPRTRRRVPRS